ncbi:MAG: VCBS repeat-containing protein, partial [Bacteroidetes bacterium]
MKKIFYILLIIFAGACQNKPSEIKSDTLFTLLPSEFTNIDFENTVENNDARFNIFTYRNYYNGGGVAICDVNNDGLPDIYLTANMKANKLYLNKGNFKFEDITEKAGVAGKKAWATGVSVADVNGDGLLDIYVCNSGNAAGDDKANELFINQGNNSDGVPTFKEMAKEYGLADEGFSTHAAFFDYDHDGDLDLYLLNNSFRPISSFGLENIRHIRDSVGGDKLFQNNNGKFVDVSEKAGIFGSVIGFGLGVTVGDVNDDGWFDIYVSNDFFERDYLYINNQNGTFTESLEKTMRHISVSSMGADMADINNDARPEIFVTDMLPETDRRIKTVTSYDSYDVYHSKLKNDYYHQFMRNMLHLNLPSTKNEVVFSEIGQLSQVDATDWSWGALIWDMDNDGMKDIFVSNGIYKDLTNQDFIDFFANDQHIKELQKGKAIDYSKILDQIPSTPIPNYAFQNQGNLKFVNQAKNWGLDKASFSNGAAYGDLDGDGDLDLVVNNVNQNVFVYRNESNPKIENNYLKIKLLGEKQNLFGIGAKIYVKANGQTFY